MTTVEHSFRLSSIQRRLFLIQQIDPASTAYNLPVVFHIEGALSLKALEEAIQNVIQRHESLRSSFKVEGDQIVKSVDEKVFFQIEFRDSTHSLQECVQPFDLGMAPLLRVILIPINDLEHIVFVDMHHIISDGKSMALFLQEVATFYEKEELPPLSWQYTDYAEWQNVNLKSSKIEEQKAYWLDQLSGDLPKLNLPTDYVRTGHFSATGNQLFFNCDEPLTTALKKLASEKRVTLYILLMAIYQAFLFKYTSQEDLIVGSSSEGRRLPELKGIIGAFVNVLPIRSFPKPEMSFSEFLEQIKYTSIDAIKNQDYPFEDLIESLSIERDLSRHPVFETYFDLHYSNQSLLQFGQLKLKPIPFSQETAKFDLSLEAIYRENQLECCFEYSTSLFRKERVEQMKNHFLNLAWNIVHDPNQKLGNLNILSEEEECQILIDVNANQTLYADFETFYKVFQKQVQQRPDAIAALCQEEHLSYRELDRLSSRLAYVLMDLGLGEEGIVAFLFDRGIYFLISLIAVFKTGGAYVPIDPDSPKERILSLIEESQPLLILATQKTEFCPSPLYLIQDLLKANVKPRDLFEIDPQNRAYLIFTSGSTGKPKGAMVEHLGMMNHLWIKVRDLELASSDIVAQTSSQTFDVSVWQFLVALMVGGKVVIFPHSQAWDPQLLLTTLERERVTVFETVPSHMNLIMEEIERHTERYPLHALKWMVLNGEPLANILANGWSQYFPSIPILNAYGPTECSDDVTHYKQYSATLQKSGTVPIGKVLDNFNVFVLDRTLSPVPFGLPGDLYFEGIGVSRGYLNDPVKTALAFLPFPFPLPGKAGKRMYRTGDIARILTDGNLECLGRSDLQIKIHGQRIELGEIEAVLSGHPGIVQVVVEARPFKNTKQLVGYVVLKNSKEDSLADVRQFAESKLPHYMVPSLFILLPALPLLTNGKVNRKALPDPDLSRVSAKPLISPRTDIESKLAVIWSELLKIPSPSIDDHFFEIGGHSLLATQMIARIHQSFGVKLPLKQFFEGPTIASLSQHIERNLKSERENIEAKLPPIHFDPKNRYAEFPLTDVQQAYWLGRSGFFDLSDVSVHVYSEYDCLDLNIEAIETAWNRVIERHEALRLVLTPQGKQKILAQVPYYKIETIDLREGETAETLQTLRDAHSHEVFDATQWPLFSIKAVMMRNSTRIYLSFDSLILDGWSVDLVFADWVHFYDEPHVTLPDLTLSFRDYVLTLQSIPTLAAYGVDKKYWTDRLDNFPLAPQLPKVKTSKEIQKQQFARCSKQFTSEKWKHLQKILLEKGITPTGFLAALFSEILGFYSNQKHFALNLTLFDRLPLHPQVNEIAGDFTSLTLLEADLRQSKSTFAERAQQMQQQLWRDLDHPLFNGVEFLREIAKHHAQADNDSLFPIVLTSAIGLNNKQNEDVLRIFGKEVFGITQTPQVWLDFKAYEVDGNLVVEWDYVKDLFASGFIEGMHKSFCDLLHQLELDQRLWDGEKIVTLTDEQREEREVYNRTKRPLKTALLHHSFNENVSLYPERPALIVKGNRYTYQEISAKSNQMGHYLRDLGVKPNHIVAIIAEKSWAQLVGVLGILQAGGAYLPIDPSTPALRVEELLKSGSVRYALTQKKFIEDFKNGQSIELIAIDDLNAPHAHYPDCPLDPVQTIQDLAYVIFTSGSTGTAKGVMIDHQAASNTILAINRKYAISSEDRVLSLSNLNFDLSVYDLFGLLSAGGTIVFPEEERIKDPSHWIELILSHQVTVWNTVPMFMQMLVEYCHQPIVSSLRLALLSGDWIPIDLPSKMRSIFEERLKIVSLGGATETAIWSNFYEIGEGEKFIKSIPYGNPLDNQQLYILDASMEACPDWVSGDLYIGGAGLSQGYLNDKAKTDSVFVDHPEFGRLYKTGDRGRQISHKGIEFLGRKDSQIKLSGYRIDVQEIEAVLTQHRDIAQAVVTVQNQKLVAHILPALKHPKENIPVNAAAFKLQQHNRRHLFPHEKVVVLEKFLDKERYFSRKSYRTFEGLPVTGAQVKEWITTSLNKELCDERSQKPITLESLSEILEKFSALNVSEYVGYKYLYPSAGGLYPVQIYIEIGEKAVEGLDGGYYYYDPFDHRLIQISSKTSGKEVTLFFVAKTDAITPIYGKLSENFCILETGYMLELLESFSYSCFNPQPDALQHFALNHSHQLVLGVTLNSVASDEKQADFRMYVYIKKEGWFSIQNGKFEALLEKEPLQLSLISQDTYAIYHEASFAIFFVSSSPYHQALLNAGSISQRLMQEGLSYGFGLCPIGVLDDQGSSTLQKVAENQQFIHGLFGGAISQSQLDSQSRSEEKKDLLEGVLREYLSTRLPKYMIPAAFVVMETLPLSSNGKIDKSALPAVHVAKRKKERILPENLWESRLISLWVKVLNISENTISIDDTFFDLGGNSLLLIQLHNAILETFHLSLPVDKLFHFPTIRTLARYLSDEQPLQLASEAIQAQAEKQRSARLAKRQRNV